MVRNQIFNVGSNDQNFTIRQVGEMIQGFVPTAKIVNVDENADKRNYWVNFNKAEKVLDFKPKWHVEQGIQQVIEAIGTGKIGDYHDAKYSNVKFLTEEGLYLLTQNKGGWAYLSEESIDTLVP